MKIKLLIAGVLTALMGSALVLAQSGTALVTLSAPTDPVRAGDTIAITVHVEGAEGVYGGSVRLMYDPLALEAMTSDSGAVTPGDLFADQPGFTLKNSADAETGSIDYAMTLRQPAEPVTGSGAMGTVEFRALRDGAAEVSVAEASLLVPRFEDVNGHKIARSIDAMNVEMQGLSLDIGGSGEPAIIAQPQVVADASQSDFETPPYLVPASPPALIQPMRTASPGVIAGVVFFLLGLLMFTLGLGSYVRLRRQFSWQDQI